MTKKQLDRRSFLKILGIGVGALAVGGGVIAKVGHGSIAVPTSKEVMEYGHKTMAISGWYHEPFGYSTHMWTSERHGRSFEAFTRAQANHLRTISAPNYDLDSLAVTIRPESGSCSVGMIDGVVPKDELRANASRWLERLPHVDDILEIAYRKAKKVGLW